MFYLEIMQYLIRVATNKHLNPSIYFPVVAALDWMHTADLGLLRKLGNRHMSLHASLLYHQ